MTRISDHLLVQFLDMDGVVILDESTGNEVVIPSEKLGTVIETLQYFHFHVAFQSKGGVSNAK